MSLGLGSALKALLTESVKTSAVIRAIDNKHKVIITYSDEKNRAPNERIIEPYAYGMTSVGNEVLRAYQPSGDSYRGVPKWKYFLLNRITSWEETDEGFDSEPNKRGFPAQPYNKEDKSMSIVIHAADFTDKLSWELWSGNTLSNAGRKGGWHKGYSDWKRIGDERKLIKDRSEENTVDQKNKINVNNNSQEANTDKGNNIKGPIVNNEVQRVIKSFDDNNVDNDYEADDGFNEEDNDYFFRKK